MLLFFCYLAPLLNKHLLLLLLFSSNVGRPQDVTLSLPRPQAGEIECNIETKLWIKRWQYLGETGSLAVQWFVGHCIDTIRNDSRSDRQPVANFIHRPDRSEIAKEKNCKEKNRRVKKGPDRYSSYGNPISELYGTSLAIWNHTVLPATRHKW